MASAGSPALPGDNYLKQWQWPLYARGASGSFVSARWKRCSRKPEWRLAPGGARGAPSGLEPSSA